MSFVLIPPISYVRSMPVQLPAAPAVRLPWEMPCCGRPQFHVIWHGTCNPQPAGNPAAVWAMHCGPGRLWADAEFRREERYQNAAPETGHR